MCFRVRVRVSDELTLDAGTCEEVSGPQGRERLIRPPETTLFRQIIAFLERKPDPQRRPSGSVAGREGVAAAAVVLRWGSYLAVLLDREKPVGREVDSPRTSRVSDDEMARINIEASAALAEWIETCLADRGGGRYEQLVNRAVSYLPMPKKTAKLEMTEIAALANPEFAARVIRSADTARLERARAHAKRHPTRLLANAMVNTAWRNGPVEDIHAGEFRGYPLEERRVTPAEERQLMTFACKRLALAMTVCLQFVGEEPRRSWPEQVLPYGLAEMLLVTPSGWTLTESSREVRLPLQVAGAT